MTVPPPLDVPDIDLVLIMALSWGVAILGAALVVAVLWPALRKGLIMIAIGAGIGLAMLAVVAVAAGPAILFWLRHRVSR